jgi:hypothetical protein
MFRHRWLATATLVSSFAAACSVGEESVDDQGAATRVSPNGTDTPGKLLVLTPAGATGVVESKVTLNDRSGSWKLGELIDGLSVGAKVVTLNTADNNGVLTYFNQWENVDIRAGQTTTLTTALLGVKVAGGPRTYGIDYASTRDSSTNWIETPRTSRDLYVGQISGNGIGEVWKTSDGSQLVPVHEGDYRVSFGFYDGVPVSLRAGETKVVSLTDFAQRRVARLKVPAPELPPVQCPNTGYDWILSSRPSPNSSPSDLASLSLAAGAELDIGTAPWNDNMSYLLRHPAWKDPTVVPLGDRGAGPKTLTTLGVVDVEDVLINSTQPRVPGTWAIFEADAQGNAIGSNLLMCRPATNSGAPMPRGHYRVEVYYNTVETGGKTDVHIIDI